MAMGAGLEVLHGLLEFAVAVHHERAVVGDGLADRLAAQDDDLEVVAAGVLGVVRPDGEGVALAEDDGLAHPERAPLLARRAAAGQAVRQTVEVAPPGQGDLGAGVHGDVDHRDGGVGGAGALMARDVTGDEPDERAAVRRGEQLHARAPDVLVLRREHLCPRRAGSPTTAARGTGRRTSPATPAESRCAAGRSRPSSTGCRRR